MDTPSSPTTLDDVDSASHLDPYDDLDDLMRETRRIARHIRHAFYDTPFGIGRIENYETFITLDGERRAAVVTGPPREGRGHTVKVYSWHGHDRGIESDLRLATFDTDIVAREQVGKAIASFIKSYLTP